MAIFPKTTLFIHDNGEVICLKHAGQYLGWAVDKARKNQYKFNTPLGTWIRIPDDEPEFSEMTCETCEREGE